RVTGRLRIVPRVTGGLELVDVLGHLLVLRGGRVDRRLPPCGFGSQIAAGDGDARDVLEAIEESERRLGRRGVPGDIVRHARPQAYRRDAGALGSQGQHAEDADGAFV